MNHRLILFPAVALTALAQSTPQASATAATQTSKPMSAAEKALRARAEAFYQLEVAQNFRQAESMVAADSRDFFYNATKPDIRNSAVDRVEFTDPNHAIVWVKVGAVAKAIGFDSTVFQITIKENWKLDGGKWCWYDLQTPYIETPFGRVRRDGRPDPPGTPPAAGSISLASPPGMANAVTADVTSVNVSSGMARVVFTNHLPAPVTLEMGNLPEGLSATLDTTEIAGQGVAAVTFSAKPGMSPKGTVSFHISPLDVTIPVEVGTGK